MAPDLNNLLCPRIWAPAAAASAFALSAYLWVHPALTRDPGASVPRPPARSPKSTVLSGLSEAQRDAQPYPPDLLPGGRDVETPYGSLRVYEWGPDDGEKVLLLHGIGTPCLALGEMAKALVARGCRVMLFGESFFSKDSISGPCHFMSGFHLRPNFD